MIQDIYPHHLYNHYDPLKRPNNDSSVFVFYEDHFLIQQDFHHLMLPTWKEVRDALGLKNTFFDCATAAFTYLFTVDEDDYFLVFVNEKHAKSSSNTVKQQDDDFSEKEKGGSTDLQLLAEGILPGYSFTTWRELRKEALGPQYMIFTAITAYQLANWYQSNRFCGRCGQPMKRDTVERALRCTVCGKIVYPRIVPAVIVGVTNGDRLLVTKYANRPISYYALVAGFTEIGETLEETVQREVMEETGLKVKNIRYYKSQPWGMVDDLLAGFYCEVDGDPTIRLDPSELKLAKWVTRDEIELQPDDYSLTNEMMKRFKENSL
ncbi:MAG: NAD(+) diphosphatase [Oribacterium sp.]|jgi:NAD+ diphosphatase|nr:NAD(+) diphosphatase [Oribacterium sp.]MDY6306746.1 NAD(+) diphosphatase [Oribacterium sp.]MDY6316800.1 NAD(+) diphosphatase [Oribacterium sp.]